MRRLVWLLLLPGVLLSQDAPEPLITRDGTWGKYVRYRVSWCAGAEPLEIHGERVWRLAQERGLGPMDHRDLKAAVDESKRRSPLAVGRTVCQITSGLQTGLQAAGAIGQKWATGWRLVGPLVGLGCVVWDQAADMHAPAPLAAPEGYLPGVVKLQPGECWHGDIIGTNEVDP